MKYLKSTDFEIDLLIKKEGKRQEETLMMIPSENYASKAVMEALGSVLTNKYSEGYPEKRYYQGQQYTDKIETLAIERAKKLFGVPYVNVQPYSGSPANAAVYFALLNPGDKIMGLSLPSGGHLTHGVPRMTFSGKYFQSIQFNVDRKTELIDYEHLEKLAVKERPKIIVAGTTHYPRVLDFPRFAKIAEKAGAYLLADVSHVIGLIVAKVYPDPAPYVDIIMSTTHKTLRGPRGAMIMVTEKGFKKDPDLGEKINKAVFPGLQGGPHNHQTAAIAVCLKEASGNSFIFYGRQIVANAKVLSESLQKLGFRLITYGTDTHVMVIDLISLGILGNTAAEGLEAAGIVLNRNTIPFDPNPPYYPSGIRLGTPAVTSRGMKEKEMMLIADFVGQVLNGLKNSKKTMKVSNLEEKKSAVRKKIIEKTLPIHDVAKKVRLLCRRFPLKSIYR